MMPGDDGPGVDAGVFVCGWAGGWMDFSAMLVVPSSWATISHKGGTTEGLPAVGLFRTVELDLAYRVVGSGAATSGFPIATERMFTWRRLGVRSLGTTRSPALMSAA